MGNVHNHLSNIEINDLWETPITLYDEAREKYGIDPKVDVCATKKNSLCPEFINGKMNALKSSWQKPFFMNPPYSQVAHFMAKAYFEHKRHNVDALILTYSKTDTKWWHEYVEDRAEVHFIAGRVSFQFKGVRPRFCTECKVRSYTQAKRCKACGKTMTRYSAPYPSVWIIYRGRK